MTEFGDGLFEDFQVNRYGLESITRNRIDLFVLGRRNKSAYFYLSDDGRINSWSDIVDLGDYVGVTVCFLALSRKLQKLE